MKKITLFIAFLAISIGSVWANLVHIPRATDNPTSDGTVPFDLNSTLPQSVEMILPVSSGVYQAVGSERYITGFAFYANGNIPEDVKNKTFTLKIAKVTATTTFGGGSSVTISNDKTVSVMPVIDVSNNALLFVLDRKDYYEYKSNAEDLYLQINVPLSTGLGQVCWYKSVLPNQYVNKSGYDGLPEIAVLTTDLKSFSAVNNNAIGGNDYDVYKDESRDLSSTASSSAILKKVHQLPSNSDTYNFTYAPFDDNDSRTREVYKYYEFDDKLEHNLISDFVSYDVTINGIDNNAFDDLVISENAAIKLPKLNKIGFDPTAPNKCFNCLISSDPSSNSNKVAFIVMNPGNDIVPDFIGSSFSNMANSNINIYLDQDWKNASLTLPSDCNSYNQIGKVSYPYKVSIMYGYDNEYKDINDNTYAKFADINKLPFGTDKMKVKLTEILEANNDGTFHKYNYFVEQSDVDIPPTAEVEVEIKSRKQSLQLSTSYDAILDYDKGNPYLSSSDVENGKISFAGNVAFLHGCKNMIFKYTDDDKVPYWRYEDNSATTNSSSAVESVTTEDAVTICVEKEINSTEYKYFSLPFDCPVADIVCTNADNGEPIELLTDNFDPLDPTVSNPVVNSDKYVILQYDGQVATYNYGQGDEIGHAKYTQITGGTLLANKGYVFAIYQKDETANVSANITFKSAADQQQTFYHDHHQYTLSNLSTLGPTDNNKQYTGWNLVGNPYYNYVGADIFNCSGVTFLVNDVNGDIRYSQVPAIDQTATSNTIIKPFQTVAIQVDQESLSLGVPTNVCNPYPSETAAPMLLPEQNAEEEFTEMVAVDVWGADNERDLTTIINDEFATDSFVIGNDMGKLFNPTVQIFTLSGKVQCAVKSLPLRQDSIKSISLGLMVPSDGNYTFALDTIYHLFYGRTILHDKQEGQYYPLNHEGVSVNLTAGTDTSRFELVVIPEDIPAELDEPVETSETLDAYVYNGRLVVENVEEGSTLSIFDVSGRMIYTAPAAGDFNYQFSAHGVYMVVLQGNTTGSIKVVY